MSHFFQVNRRYIYVSQKNNQYNFFLCRFPLCSLVILLIVTYLTLLSLSHRIFVVGGVLFLYDLKFWRKGFLDLSKYTASLENACLSQS